MDAPSLTFRDLIPGDRFSVSSLRKSAYEAEFLVAGAKEAGLYVRLPTGKVGRLRVERLDLATLKRLGHGPVTLHPGDVVLFERTGREVRGTVIEHSGTVLTFAHLDGHADTVDVSAIAEGTLRVYFQARELCAGDEFIVRSKSENEYRGHIVSVRDDLIDSTLVPGGKTAALKLSALKLDTLRVLIPLVLTESVPTGSHIDAAEPEPPGAPQQRVLVVDDSRGMRELVMTNLEREGFRCEGASDGIDALAWAMGSPFDALVIDANMPRMDGLTLIGQLRDRAVLRGAALIVMSADATVEERARALAADAFLKKPFKGPELVAEVRRILAARSAVGATAAIPAAAVQSGTVSGKFGSMRPSEVCNVLHGARRSGRLEFLADDGRHRGVVRLRSGEIVSAQLHVDGAVVETSEPALTAIFALPSGTFRLDVDAGGTLAALETRNIARPTPRVIAEALGRPGSAEGTRVGPFEVVEVLWSGADHEVYRARRVEGSGDPAARLVVERGTRRKPGDLEALRRLDVPGIARLRSWGSLPAGGSWFETELAVGPTLDEVVQDQGPLGAERAVGLFGQLLESLAAAHRAGIPHGAIDVRRIVLPCGERPVLLDHGLGLASRGPVDHLSACATAPEVWRGAAPDARADLYSVGCVIFYALAGRHPHEHKSTRVLADHHLGKTPRSLREAGVPDPGPALEAFVARLLAKDPAARPEAAVARAELASLQPEDAIWDANECNEPEIPPPSGYRFVRKLGEGATGQVFEARHVALDKLVAVKVMHDRLGADVRRRFLREARVTASLEHPNIVQVFDVREEARTIYIVMEFVKGESLSARLAREGSIAEPEVLAIARQALDALAAAHDRGIVHRDVKPDNLLMSPGGRVKIADFGLARTDDGGDAITKNGLLLGTPSYISPEQCQGEPADARSDLYSLGATLYHLLAARPPFRGTTIMAILRQHVETPARPLQEVAPRTSPELAAVVAKLLEKDPGARYASARDVLAALPINRD